MHSVRYIEFSTQTKTSWAARRLAVNASNISKQVYIGPTRHYGGRCSLKAGSVATGTPRRQPGVRGCSGAEPDAQVAEEDQGRESSLPPLANRHPEASRSWLGR